MDLNVEVRTASLFREDLYQGTASAVPMDREKVWASAPEDAGKPQRLKPLVTDLLRHG